MLCYRSNMADGAVEPAQSGFVGDGSPVMKVALIDWIRKSKSNATIVAYVRRDFGLDWRTLMKEVPLFCFVFFSVVYYGIDKTEITGPGRHIGYRHMHQRLRMRHDLPVKRKDVYQAMQILDACGMEARRKRVCRRRDYVSVGSNWIWHLDGHDKLKPYGFAIHAAIDGFSRKILWCHIHATNNDPKYIAKYYCDYVQQNQVVPAMTRSDAGTENGLLATCQMFLRRNCSDNLAGNKSHVYGSSMANQRIEAYWHNQREHNRRYWESEFEHLSANGLLVPDDPLHKASLQYVYMPLLQQELREFVEEHNSHRIRKQHGRKTPQGIPEDLYNFPELTGFKQAGFQPDVSDLRYLRLEQGLGQNLPDYLTADFRSLADAFFDVDITIQTARDAYSSLVSHVQMLSQ